MPQTVRPNYIRKNPKSSEEMALQPIDGWEAACTDHGRVLIRPQSTLVLQRRLI
jgi:hypothetical protein